VATSGQILNIHDAYKDERFNRGVDQVTGYLTKTILCMPVFIRSTIIGVVQMVNKRRGQFTKDDEDAFEMFAVYCGLALHHAKLYDKIRRSEQKYRVALDVLSYHNSCSEEEFEAARAMGVPKSIPGLSE
jgi:cAMP and cAMP-inhibited cGMP 3',5'-cyclic phosphodiesterase 10